MALLWTISGQTVDVLVGFRMMAPCTALPGLVGIFANRQEYTALKVRAFFGVDLLLT